MGNGKTETRTYNSRLQPTKIQVGSLLTILNCYQTSDDPSYCNGLPVQVNNGNVQRQKITRSSQSWVQNYTYDAVNRLLTAAEKIGSTDIWSQSYGYDAYGNRWLSGGLAMDPATPSDQNWFDADTNRLAGTNNYDDRGNQTLYGSYTLTYDGDDKVSAASGILPSTKYEYDGEGRRVRAHSCPGSTTCTPGAGANTTIFVYDAFGKLAMEYRPDAAVAGTSYYTQDHLGSTRLETNASGQQVKCSDYLPFGEEILPGYGSRSSCFGANENKIKFTGKERDAETGLDYFGARYFSGALGRFTSADNFANDTHTTDPQSWNLYTYVRNNPIRLIDPNGERVYVGGVTGSDRDELINYINYTYGCEACTTVDEDGYLSVDTTGLSESVLKATADLTDAINTTKWFAEVKISNYDDDIQFGKTDPYKGAAPYNGLKRNADLITLDLADNKQIHGDDLIKQTFVSTILPHEILHRWPNKISDPKSGTGTGPVVDAVNRITDARGLPHRSQYFNVPGLVNGTEGQKFIYNKEAHKIWWWKNEVGGRQK